MPENIFVLGLDEWNHTILRDLPGAGGYRFHQLLSFGELRGTTIDLPELLRHAQQELAMFTGRISAIVGYWDFPVTSMVPMLCRPRGLRSASLAAVAKCEHKYWSRLEQREVIDEYPRFALIDLHRQPTLPAGLRYPVWIKPVKSFRSQLAFRACDDSGLRHATAEIRAGIGRLGEPFQYVLDQLDQRELPPEVACAGGEATMVEEEIGGAQLTVEGYAHGGDVRVCGVVDTLRYPGSPCFLRYRYPSQLPEDTQQHAAELTRRVIRRIGLNDVTFNVEFFADPASGRLGLLEVNPRHSQSHAPLFAAVDGVANHHSMVRLALGHDPRMPHRQGRWPVAAKWFLRRFTDGVLRRVPTTDEITRVERETPGVRVRVTARTGQRLSELPDQDSYSYELAHVYTGGTSEQDLIAKFERCRERLPFEVES